MISGNTIHKIDLTHVVRSNASKLLAILIAATVSACASAGNNRTAVQAPPSSTDIPTTQQETPTSTTANSYTLEQAGSLQPRQLVEASGMSFSGQQADVIWLINDSGNPAELFAIDTAGQELGVFQIKARNRDWEDLTRFTVNGESFLLVTDIGDNRRIYDDYLLHVLAEPLIDSRSSANSSIELEPVMTFAMRYPDGSHNGEAAAVANDGYLYLITKAESPAVYRTPLIEAFITERETRTQNGNVNNPASVPLSATRLGDYQRPPLSTSLSLVNAFTGVDFGSVTAMDVDNNLGEAWVLTYRSLYRLPATDSGDWVDVFLGEPQLITEHDLRQAESMAFSPSTQQIYLTSEDVGAPLLSTTTDAN